MANHRPQYFECHRLYTRKVYLRKIQKRGRAASRDIGCCSYLVGLLGIEIG
jgi:hypothetical protein